MALAPAYSKKRLETRIRKWNSEIAELASADWELVSTPFSIFLFPISGFQFGFQFRVSFPVGCFENCRFDPPNPSRHVGAPSPPRGRGLWSGCVHARHLSTQGYEGFGSTSTQSPASNSVCRGWTTRRQLAAAS